MEQKWQIKTDFLTSEILRLEKKRSSDPVSTLKQIGITLESVLISEMNKAKEAHDNRVEYINRINSGHFNAEHRRYNLQNLQVEYNASKSRSYETILLLLIKTLKELE